MRINAKTPPPRQHGVMRQPISTAPVAHEVELAVVDDKIHPLAYPCVLTDKGWINALTRRHIEPVPTHWRRLPAVTYFCCCG